MDTIKQGTNGHFFNDGYHDTELSIGVGKREFRSGTDKKMYTYVALYGYQVSELQCNFVLPVSECRGNIP